jgi:hypothetical protein
MTSLTTLILAFSFVQQQPALLTLHFQPPSTSKLPVPPAEIEHSPSPTTALLQKGLTINVTRTRRQPTEATYHYGPVSLWYEEEGDTLHLVYTVYASQANFTRSCPLTDSSCSGNFALNRYGFPGRDWAEALRNLGFVFTQIFSIKTLDCLRT